MGGVLSAERLRTEEGLRNFFSGRTVPLCFRKVPGKVPDRSKNEEKRSHGPNGISDFAVTKNLLIALVKLRRTVGPRLGF